MPIIIITANGDISISVKAMKKGAVDSLQKPFDDVQLLEAIENAIEKNRQDRARLSEVQSVRDRIAALTPRENEVFRYVIKGFCQRIHPVSQPAGFGASSLKPDRLYIPGAPPPEPATPLIGRNEKSSMNCSFSFLLS